MCRKMSAVVSASRLWKAPLECRHLCFKLSSHNCKILHQNVSHSHATKPCYQAMLPSHATKPCYQAMLPSHATKPCYQAMLPSHATKPCYQAMLPSHATICYSTSFTLPVGSFTNFSMPRLDVPPAPPGALRTEPRRDRLGSMIRCNLTHQ